MNGTVDYRRRDQVPASCPNPASTRGLKVQVGHWPVVSRGGGVPTYDLYVSARYEHGFENSFICICSVSILRYPKRNLALNWIAKLNYMLFFFKNRFVVDEYYQITTPMDTLTILDLLPVIRQRSCIFIIMLVVGGC